MKALQFGLVSTSIFRVVAKTREGGGRFFLSFVFLDGAGLKGGGGGSEGVLTLNFALACTKTLATKPVPGFASL